MNRRSRAIDFSFLHNRRFLHFAAMLAILLFFFYVQTLFLSRLSSSWFHIDLITIFIIFISIEHMIIPSLINIMLVATLMQVYSMAPGGFFISYYLLVFILSHAIARLIVVHKLFGQFIVFFSLFLLKYVMAYSSFVIKELPYSLQSFVFENYKECIVTSLVSVPIFKTFSFIDFHFEHFRSRRSR